MVALKKIILLGFLPFVCLYSCTGPAPNEITVFYANEGVECKGCSGSWRDSTFSDAPIEFIFNKGAMAIFLKNDQKIILPQKHRKTYTLGEIDAEFDRKLEDVKGYIAYYVDEVKKGAPKQREVYTTSFRGVVEPIAPDNCITAKKKVFFKWKVPTDFEGKLRFEILAVTGDLIFADTLSSLTDGGVEMNTDSLGLEAGKGYRWAVFPLGAVAGEPLEFSIPSQAALEEKEMLLKNLAKSLKEYPEYLVKEIKISNLKRAGFCP